MQIIWRNSVLSFFPSIGEVIAANTETSIGVTIQYHMLDVCKLSIHSNYEHITFSLH